MEMIRQGYFLAHLKRAVRSARVDDENLERVVLLLGYGVQDPRDGPRRLERKHDDCNDWIQIPSAHAAPP